MRSIFLLLCCLTTLHLQAQRVIDVSKNDRVDESMFFSVSGEPFVNVKFVNVVAGSPYFKDVWMRGRAISADGKKYSGIFKLNLIDDQLIFLDAEVREMIATTKVTDLTLTDPKTNAEYHLIHSEILSSYAGLKKGWYTKLVDGKISLLQRLNKHIIESKPYGSATVEQRIVTNDEFFVAAGNKMIAIKKLKDAPAMFPDKKEMLEKHLHDINDKLKSTAEKMVSLVVYYNSL